MNLALTLQAAAERHPEREALVGDGTRLTYAGLRDRVARLAGGLARLGLQRGGHLAALVRNRHEAVALYWACQWLGAWFVPLNFRLAPAEVAYCVRDAEAGLLCFEAVSAEAAHAVADHQRRLIALDDDPRADATFSELIEGPEAPGALDLPADAISLMLYTSGTTGRPKGVPRSHRADRAAALAQVIHHGYDDGDRTLCTMPLYHTMGLHSTIAMAPIGGCLVMLPEWSARAALELIERERLTSLYLGPTLFHDLCSHSAREQADLGSVRSLGYAGAPMTGALVRRCLQTFRPRIFFNHYGSTEAYIWSVDVDQAAKPGCAGRPALNSRLRLVRPEPDAGPDDVVGAGEEGQIISDMASDEAFDGYWKRPDADADAIRDGWYYTGDIGRLDQDGDLWVIGRMDDMIVSGGENVHPVEVEDVLAAHPGVAEVAVVGAPDDRWGTRVVAFVVADGDAEAGDLDAHCKASSELANFKRPREYHFVDELPKSASGKLLRRRLREQIG